MKHILVTGANGFVGTHLVKELSDSGFIVSGIGGSELDASDLDILASYTTLDLRDPNAVNSIDFSNIDGIVHLAGLAAVGPSFDDPMQYITTNIGIEVNLFEAALAQKMFPKFLIISSGSLYDPASSLPLHEQSPVAPSSPYAVSKLGQEQMAQYYATRGFHCVVARPFNHIGPGQGNGFIVPDIASQLVSIENGVAKRVLVGNLESERDYTDVRDIVAAYRLLIENGISGEIYNICSGKPLSGRDIFQALQEAIGFTAEVEQDPSKLRPADNPVIYGDNQKLATATGWHPKISLETTMRDVISVCRSAQL